jgi:two-component system response regulator MprA
VVVLDLMLPGLDGVAVCRRLRTASDVAILMLTARDGVADRVHGLDAGADDYLVKPFAQEELLARVRALLRRRTGADAPLLEFADLTLNLAEHEVRRKSHRIELTALEFQLLEHFLRHPRHVLTRDQLLEAVWGFDAETASNVVDVYVGYLRSKLESEGEPRLIQTVRGVGYVLREA